MKHSGIPWHDTFNNAKERGVRNPGGFICFLPKPTHYTGQDERYEFELDEYKANAKLISKCPEMLEALKEAKDIIIEMNCMIECIDKDTIDGINSITNKIQSLIKDL